MNDGINAVLQIVEMHERHGIVAAGFFPELRFVLKHGCDPWAEFAVALLLKRQNLFYCTSASNLKHYPKPIMDFANTRGFDKFFYVGYFPHGLTLERIFEEMPNVSFREHVWPKFLGGNELAVLKAQALRLSGSLKPLARRRRGFALTGTAKLKLARASISRTRGAA